MRFSYSYFLICLALIVCLQSALAAPQDAVRRQDDSPSEDSPASTTREAASSQRPTATPTPTPTPSEAASSSIESSPPSSTAPSSTKPSEPANTPTQVPSAEPAPKPAPSSSPDKNANPLPLPPTLTPAMGVSGVILLLSGLTYGIVGIKKRMIYVFGSAAYLTALAVTVLIVYLMNPPVSNAIQGAFFVAAFFTGAIFGALSLVFVDITEGFGCLLGGFCLSMWFLSLKDGGLISSGAGRAIFIGCMSAGGYCLSFSRYTRNYGLIGSIAFSGATAAILGIDCLAGAGWKEFWLYLWDLNDSIFPLDTNTYPVTRNMKAELAGVVIIAVAGIISQLRVWKMVKEHRAKDAAQQRERQQDLDREEEERGRMIEDELQKERAQWEAAYGGKSLPESSPRSSMASPKGSTSVEEKELHSTDNLEMATHGGVAPSVGANKSSGGMVTVSVLQDDDIQQIDAHGNPIVHDNSVVVPEVESEKSLPDTPQVPQPALIRKDSRPTPPPAVVPLPFTIPKEETDQNDDDNASVSAIPETEPDVSERPQVSKRVSDVSAMRQRISRDMAVSQEVLLQDLHVEDDRASSVAATLDNDNDMMSVRELSPVQSPIGLEERKDPFDDVVPAKSADDADVAKEQNTVPDQANHSLVVTPQSPTTSASATLEEQGGKSSDAQDEARADTVVSSSKDSSVDRHSKAAHSDALSLGSQAEKAGQRVSVLRDGALPDTLSKVALSYRTNEWAKHLEAAEKPDYEDIFMPSSSSVLLPNGVEEKPAPVSEELVAPLMESRRNSKRISSGSRMQRNSIGVERTSLTLSQESLVDPRFSTRSPPAAVLSRANSRSQGDVLAPLPTNTLLSKRENLIKNRASALMLSPHSSSTTLLGDHADEEDMTLAQRRQLLQRQSISPDPAYESPLTSPRRAPPSASQKWQSKGWAGSGAPAGFDSHQPQRTNSAQSNNKREQLYAGWRDSIRDVTPQSTTYILEQQRAALLQERRQKEMAKQQRELVQQQRASQMDSMMRSGQMLDAHREAMRRMQANANKHA